MRNYYKLFFFLSIFTLLFTTFSCKSKIEKPNIIIFIADDVSWDDLGCYGNDFVKTPNIDFLAKNGIIFKNTYLTTSSCSPSRNSIMTGRYPHNTGAAELHTEPPIDMISMAELLNKNGYFTLLAGKFHMGKYAKRGFDEVHENYKINGNGGEGYWLSALEKRPKNKPFFMWFASYDAHRVWGDNIFSGSNPIDKVNVPEYLVDLPATRKDLADYYDEITRFDHYVGKVVKKLKSDNVFDNTLIIVMADNGRPFPHSKTRLNNQGVKTPFVVSFPNKMKFKGTQSTALISAIDIAPTIIDIAGIDLTENFQGKSFKKILSNPKKHFRNYVFAEHNWHDYEAHQRMVSDGKFMYIVNNRSQFPQTGPLDAINSPTYQDLKDALENGSITQKQNEIFVNPRNNEEFYNLTLDPFQFNNLLSSGTSEEYIHLKKVLNQWMDETGDDVPESLTKDYYLRDQEKGVENSSLKTDFYQTRGIMPGFKSNAIIINNKGPF